MVRYASSYLPVYEFRSIFAPDILYPCMITSQLHLADRNAGPIFRLTTYGKSRVFISSHELVDEVCDEERFTKAVRGSLEEIRNGVHDGLFTAHYPGEENWAIAHRILVPAFGPLSIRGMFDGELGIVQCFCQLPGLIRSDRNVRYCLPARHEMGAARAEGANHGHG